MIDQKAHRQAIERFKLGTDAIAKQATRETEDLQFQIPEPEFQWSPEARSMRAGSTAGNVATPAERLNGQVGYAILRRR